jgi:pantoate--beta-alanine ligase
MQIVETAEAAHAFVAGNSQRRVLVPTMGALHHGHLELIRLAREAAGADGHVAVSIFVNPLQFEPGGDYERYPRPGDADEEACRRAGVDLLFRPTPAEMYHSDRSVAVEETALSETMCGKSRPGHFRGVCTVVTKLFHLLAPQAAVFGEKDFQQLAIIRRMVRLASSSRNAYLDAEERRQATVLRAALLEAAELARSGETSAARIVDAVRTRIASAPLARIDYVELVDADTLEAQPQVSSDSLVAVAVFFGKTRLIDNIRLR